MVSSDSVPRPEPVDPDYDAFFRSGDEPGGHSDRSAPALATPEPDEEPMFEQVLDPVIDPRDEESVARGQAADPEPAAALPVASAVDTGRLFRSQGVTADSAAVLAIPGNQGGRLRTMGRATDRTTGPADHAAAEPADAAIGPDLASGEDVSAHGAADVLSDSRTRRPRGGAGHSSGTRTVSAGGVYIVVIGTTMLVGIANALRSGGEIGWPTGLALAVSSVYCALTVRREDDVVAILTPPIAFFLVAVTAGQAFRGSSGGGLVNRAQLVFFSLADNWYWIIGATLAATVIVIVRRRRA